MFREYLPTCITKLKNKKLILFYKCNFKLYLQTEKEARDTPSPRGQDESNHEEDDDEPLGDDEDEDEDEEEEDEDVKIEPKDEPVVHGGGPTSLITQPHPSISSENNPFHMFGNSQDILAAITSSAGIRLPHSELISPFHFCTKGLKKDKKKIGLK